jgi:anti-sigma B factor antagonist
MKLFDEPAVKRLSQLCSMSVEYELETVAVRLRGEFDLTCEEQFREELESAFEARPTSVVIDLHGLTFIDSVGLLALVGLKEAASDVQIRLTLLCGEGHVRRVLRETGLDGILPVFAEGGAVAASDSLV